MNKRRSREPDGGAAGSRGDQATGVNLRQAPRRELSGQKPGVLRLADSGRLIKYVGVDISRSGIGIVTSDSVFPETMVIFELDGRAIELELVWSSQGEDSMRYGFRVRDQGVDLDMLAGK